MLLYGYSEPEGYKGLIDGEWMIFATEDEYEEYFIAHFETKRDDD